MTNFFMGFLKALKLPVKFLRGQLRKKPKITKREQKQRKYVANFDKSRVKNRAWKNLDKWDKEILYKNKKKKTFSKKANNWTLTRKKKA